MVSGLSDLEELLASMEASTDGLAYAFCSVPGTTWPPTVPGGVEPVAVVVEQEATTLVVPLDQASAAGLDHDLDFVAARITLRVHSDLTSVGLTARVATALAAVAIPTNVVAGRFHDHLFVPGDRAGEALAVLDGLATSHQEGPG